MHCINNMNGIASGLIIASCVFYSCTSRTGEISPVHEQQTDSLSQDTIVQPEVKPVNKKLTAEQIEISKDLLYDQYTLEDTYPYKDTTSTVSILLAILFSLPFSENKTLSPLSLKPDTTFLGLNKDSLSLSFTSYNFLPFISKSALY